LATVDERLGGLVLIGLRDRIVATINGLFPNGPVEAFKHRGEWTEESVAAYASKTPCIAIAYTGAKDWETDGDGTNQGLIAITAFVITEVADGDEDDASLALTEFLLRLVPGNRFGAEHVSGGENADGLNQYTHKLDDKGVNIHSVTWVHQIELSKLTAAELAALPDFLRLFTRAHPGSEIDGPIAPQEHMNEVREP
jgi:hypothetical protein